MLGRSATNVQTPAMAKTQEIISRGTLRPPPPSPSQELDLTDLHFQKVPEQLKQLYLTSNYNPLRRFFGLTPPFDIGTLTMLVLECDGGGTPPFGKSF